MTKSTQKYIALARARHPDALRLQKSTASSSNALDFCEIAAAWRTLSNAKMRKRYDRSLAAEVFSSQVSMWAGDFCRAAISKVVNPKQEDKQDRRQRRQDKDIPQPSILFVFNVSARYFALLWIHSLCQAQTCVQRQSQTPKRQLFTARRSLTSK